MSDVTVFSPRREAAAVAAMEEHSAELVGDGGHRLIGDAQSA